jgi:hypothetical protein
VLIEINNILYHTLTFINNLPLKGFCKNGDKCKYKHTLGAEATVSTNNNNAEDNTAVAAPDAMVE